MHFNKRTFLKKKIVIYFCILKYVCNFAAFFRTNLFEAIIGFKSQVVHGFRVSLRAPLEPLIADVLTSAISF